MRIDSPDSRSFPSSSVAVRAGYQMKYLILSMRPHQWTKNIVIFAAVIFSRNIFRWDMVAMVMGAFLLFCAYSGCIYIINDLIDKETDQKHPLKCQRPLASGRLAKSTAIWGAVVIGVSSFFLAWFMSESFFLIALSYVVLQVAYSLRLKHIVILDVFSIAGGFVLRVIAGAEVIHVPISSWLLICTMLLALFLALSKRRHELVFLKGDATSHRKILQEYSPYLLDQMIAVVTPATVVAYALYTVAPETVQKFHTSRLIYTVPFVIYGIMRYLYLIHQKKEGGRPEELLVTDKPLLTNILLYGLTVVFILYW
ncbi:MAG: decaprenyl-phosphate phosphoribosyltransferase [bacterium]